MKIKFNKECVFLNSKAEFMVLKLTKKNKRRFVSMLKSDALTSIAGLSILPPNLSGHFTWEYAKFKNLIEKEWVFLGELQ